MDKRMWYKSRPHIRIVPPTPSSVAQVVPATQSESNMIDINSIHTERNDTLLMQISEMLIKWDNDKHSNLYNGPLQSIWSGHKQFITSVSAWWANHGFITEKQRDALAKILNKYTDRIEWIIDQADQSIDTGSEPAIFGIEDLHSNPNSRCPVCDDDHSFFTTNENYENCTVWKCKLCGFKAIYMKFEDEE